MTDKYRVRQNKKEKKASQYFFHPGEIKIYSQACTFAVYLLWKSFSVWCLSRLDQKGILARLNLTLPFPQEACRDEFLPELFHMQAPHCSKLRNHPQAAPTNWARRPLVGFTPLPTRTLELPLPLPLWAWAWEIGKCLRLVAFSTNVITALRVWKAVSPEKAELAGKVIWLCVPLHALAMPFPI
jgi:hypothetical protein